MTAADRLRVMLDAIERAKREHPEGTTSYEEIMRHPVVQAEGDAGRVLVNALPALITAIQALQDHAEHARCSFCSKHLSELDAALGGEA